MTTMSPELQDTIGKVVTDLGATANAALVIVGDRLGLYKALNSNGPCAPDDLAKLTGTAPRYVREWLSAQAASGYVAYDPATERFSMTPEQAMVLADENSPCFMAGGFYAAAAAVNDESKLAHAFKTGEGIAWGEHHTCLFCGTEKFFRPGYDTNLVQSWIPALTGRHELLEAGATVADIGCGHGVSTLVMAKAYPNSTFVGFDSHKPSIEHAAFQAQEHGLTNVRFELGTAQDFPTHDGEPYDLVTIFDALHDMGDPIGAAMRVRENLTPDGSWMIVEPNASDDLEDNLNPVGRVFYAFSTSICVPCAMSQKGGEALGAQAGPARITDVATRGGFTDCRVATSTPFNLVFEARG